MNSEKGQTRQNVTAPFAKGGSNNQTTQADLSLLWFTFRLLRKDTARFKRFLLLYT